MTYNVYSMIRGGEVQKLAAQVLYIREATDVDPSGSRSGFSSESSNATPYELRISNGSGHSIRWRIKPGSPAYGDAQALFLAASPEANGGSSRQSDLQPEIQACLNAESGGAFTQFHDQAIKRAAMGSSAVLVVLAPTLLLGSSCPVLATALLLALAPFVVGVAFGATTLFPSKGNSTKSSRTLFGFCFPLKQVKQLRRSAADQDLVLIKEKYREEVFPFLQVSLGILEEFIERQTNASAYEIQAAKTAVSGVQQSTKQEVEESVEAVQKVFKTAKTAAQKAGQVIEAGQKADQAAHQEFQTAHQEFQTAHQAFQAAKTEDPVIVNTVERLNDRVGEVERAIQAASNAQEARQYAEELKGGVTQLSNSCQELGEAFTKNENVDLVQRFEEARNHLRAVGRLAFEDPRRNCFSTNEPFFVQFNSAYQRAEEFLERVENSFNSAPKDPLLGDQGDHRVYSGDANQVSHQVSLS